VISRDIRVLFVEDDSMDAELEARALTSAGFRVVQKVVAAPDAFALALEELQPQVILADFSMPEFSGPQALQMARRLRPDVPFIFVSGTIGEERAIAALTSGATDYVLKSNLARLPAAVERALTEAGEKAERRRLSQALRESQGGLLRAQLMAKLAHVVTGVHGSFETWSETLPALIGVDPASVPQSTGEWLERVHAEDREAFRSAAIESRASRRRTELAYRVRHSNGSWIYLQQTMEPLLQSARSGVRWFNTVQDVTERKLAEQKIARLNRVHAVLSGINSAIVRLRDRQELFDECCRIAVEHGRFVMAWVGVLDAAASMVRPVAWAGEVRGFLESAPPAMLESKPGGVGLAGRAVRSRLPLVSNDLANDPQRLMRDELRERGIRSLAVFPLIVGDAAAGVLALYASEVGLFDEQEMRLLLELAGDIGFCLEHIDKTERLAYAVNYDALTGLANRNLFHERLAQAVQAARRAGSGLAVVLLDLERFKAICDTFGMSAGDQVLRSLAQRLRATAEADDRIGRVGGDLFGVIIDGIEGPQDVARRIDATCESVLGASVAHAGKEIRLAARAGIATYPEDGADADALFRNAEAALKRAKETRERYVFYAPHINARVAEQVELESRLRAAVAHRELFLHFQPKFELPGKQLIGVEALMRWRGHDGQLVSPAAFIPLLEQTGLILEAGRQAIQGASAAFRKWQRAYRSPPRIAVNVSALQLRRDSFVADFLAALPCPADGGGVDLEITESLLMQDVDGSIRKLRELRSHGICIALDDFGTGYSSLAYLGKLPLDSVKIDRAFIRGLGESREDASVVATIIGLAHTLGLKVVAEGVETPAQAALLQALHCDQVQGFLFGRPMPADELEALLG
jgi:diguanylate cyclase (GGDEF)-like protein/PAS domain S-box-containing protein